MPRGMRWRVTREMRDRIVADYRAGASISPIGRTYGVSANTVLRVLHERGVTLRTESPAVEGAKGKLPLIGGDWVLDPVKRVRVWRRYEAS